MSATTMAQRLAGSSRQEQVFARVNEPLGYPDGLNAYSVLIGNPLGGVDPMGLKIIILLDSQKAGEILDPTKWNGAASYKRHLEQIVSNWNSRIDMIMSELKKRQELGSQTCKLNDETSGWDKLKEALEAARMELRVLSPDQKTAAKEISDATIEAANSGGEVLFETHSQPPVEGPAGVNEPGSVRIGGTFVPMDKIADVLGKLSSKFTFGSCFFDEQGVKELAQSLGTAVGGSPDMKHFIIPGLPSSTTEIDNKGGKVFNVKLHGPFNAAKLHGVPVHGGVKSTTRPTGP